MNTIPSASEMLNAKVSEWRRRIDNYISQNGFFRDDEKGALRFEITSELLALLTGFKEIDVKNRKLYEMANAQFQEYLDKYADADCGYEVKYQYLARPGTTNVKPYFIAIAKKE